MRTEEWLDETMTGGGGRLLRGHGHFLDVVDFLCDNHKTGQVRGTQCARVCMIEKKNKQKNTGMTRLVRLALLNSLL